jgi:hypothetical protein
MRRSKSAPLAVGGDEGVHRGGATGLLVSEADVAAGDVAAAEVPATGITARVARLSLRTGTRGAGLTGPLLTCSAELAVACTSSSCRRPSS